MHLTGQGLESGSHRRVSEGPANTFCVATRLCESLAVGQQCNPCHGHPKHTSILARLILKRDDNVGTGGTKEQSRSHICQLFKSHKRLKMPILELCNTSNAGT